MRIGLVDSRSVGAAPVGIASLQQQVASVFNVVHVLLATSA